MSYNFYGWDKAFCCPVSEKYKKIENPRVLYDLLSKIWCKESCAPRLRPQWSRENKTLGQCSITAFLAQDIFGGEVCGIARPQGNFHCYNKVNETVFDLTSEQFEGEVLSYENNPLQSRDEHFKNAEKYRRYEYLKSELEKFL